MIYNLHVWTLICPHEAPTFCLKQQIKGFQSRRPLSMSNFSPWALMGTVIPLLLFQIVAVTAAVIVQNLPVPPQCHRPLRRNHRIVSWSSTLLTNPPAHKYMPFSHMESIKLLFLKLNKRHFFSKLFSDQIARYWVRHVWPVLDFHLIVVEFLLEDVELQKSTQACLQLR